MFCSTIIPTVGRETLARAVCSVLDQKFDRDSFEVIVVNDSGQPLPEADWQKSGRVRVMHTNRHNRSVARNTGAAIARGRYLHFLDDDDWMLPDAFESLWELANTSQAAWLYGAFRLVDNAEETVAEVFPDETGNCYIQLIAAEWIPLQASLIEAEAFFAVGGFASLHSLLGGYEDIDLSRLIVRYYDMAGTRNLLAGVRAGDVGSTTNYVDMFDQNRQSREKALSTPGSFSRMRASASVSPSDSSYWYGRIVYYYLASLRWNLRHKRLFTAASRGVYALAGFSAAGRHILAPGLWRGASKRHSNQVEIALIESGMLSLFANTEWRSR